MPCECGSIIEYSPTTSPSTLDVHFIASRAAPAIAASAASQQLAGMALNLLQLMTHVGRVIRASFMETKAT